MRCEVRGDGREVLHSCDSWSELVEWFRGYTADGSGGWGWFELWRDGEIAAKYAVIDYGDEE